MNLERMKGRKMNLERMKAEAEVCFSNSKPELVQISTIITSHETLTSALEYVQSWVDKKEECFEVMQIVLEGFEIDKVKVKIIYKW